MKRATVKEVRRVLPSDGVFLQPSAWVAFDTDGRRFGGDTEAEARHMAEDFNTPKRQPKNERTAA